MPFRFVPREGVQSKLLTKQGASAYGTPFKGKRLRLRSLHAETPSHPSEWPASRTAGLTRLNAPAARRAPQPTALQVSHSAHCLHCRASTSRSQAPGSWHGVCESSGACSWPQESAIRTGLRSLLGRPCGDGWLCVCPPDDHYGRPRLRPRVSLPAWLSVYLPL